MQVVILAGGLATRMRPRTFTVPKLLLEVAGRPFVDWQLDALARCGYQDVVICVAYLGEQVRAYLGDGARHGVRIRYSDEGSNLLGTAGALRRALDLLEPVFLVTYGDSYLPFDYAAPLDLLSCHADCDGVMSVYRNSGAWDASNTRLAAGGAWVDAYEKGTTDASFDCIDYGAIALRRSVVASLPEGGPRGLDAVQTSLARQRRLRAYVAPTRFFEIGSPEGLEALERHLERERA